MKTKALKTILTVLLCAILTIGMVISVFADFSVWHSDSYAIGTWEGTQIKYAHKKLNNNTYFYFYASGLHAIKQWEDALDITIENVLLVEDANIKVYGGTWDEITSLGFPYYASALGYAYFTESSPLKTDTIDGKKVSVRLISGAVVVIIDKGLMSDYNHVTTHELGHALGWSGHSEERSDLMYNTNNGTAELTPNDSEHLRQVY